MGKTFRRGGNERGYYSPGKSIRISDKKVVQTEQTGQTNQTMTTFSKQIKNESLTQSETMTTDGTENERESEILEFDDCSEVDYDLDYTVQY